MATIPAATELGIVTVTAPTTELAYEILEGEGAFTKHVVAVDVDHGLQVQTIDEEHTQPLPRRAKGDRKVGEVDSFLAELVRRPLIATGTLWGNADTGTLTAVYNDHDPAPYVGGWRDDRLVLQLKADADWKAWHEMSGQFFGQVGFGDKVEDLLHTVISPDQAELLEVIDSVRASSKGSFESTIERSNGGQKIAYKEEVNASAGRSRDLEVPQLITLLLRPWEGHDVQYEIDAYFRLRVQQGTLALGVKLKPTRQIVRQAWEEITSKVSAAVDKPVYAQ
jgi:uncharacterized protein YfdQ (DUF2303 family)